MAALVLTDRIAQNVEAIFKQASPDATLFPAIGLPSQNNGVLFLTHTLSLGVNLKINGLVAKSPLAANALYSAEVIKNGVLNIYEAQIPDIPGINGKDSTAQIYTKALIKQGLTPAGSHQHWTGEYFYTGSVRDHNVAAIHCQEYSMHPETFAKKIVAALIVVVTALKKLIPSPRPDPVDTSNFSITDKSSKKILRLWKTEYPDAFILPVVGEPLKNGGKYAVFTHTLGDGMLMNVNGYESKSPLSNNALYSFEVVNNKYLHFYEIMLPDIPGKNGERSTVQIYVNELTKNGLDVAGLHWHFWGGVGDPQDRGVLAIHHQNVGLSPKDFTLATIKALKVVGDVIKQRTGNVADPDPDSDSDPDPSCVNNCPCGKACYNK